MTREERDRCRLAHRTEHAEARLDAYRRKITQFANCAAAVVWASVSTMLALFAVLSGSLIVGIVSVAALLLLARDVKRSFGNYPWFAWREVK